MQGKQWELETGKQMGTAHKMARLNQRAAEMISCGINIYRP